MKDQNFGLDVQQRIQERAKAIAQFTANEPEFQSLESWGRSTLTKSALDRAEMLLCKDIHIPDGWKKWIPFLRLPIVERIFQKFANAILKHQIEASKLLLIAIRNLQAENEKK